MKLLAFFLIFAFLSSSVGSVEGARKAVGVTTKTCAVLSYIEPYQVLPDGSSLKSISINKNPDTGHYFSIVDLTDKDTDTMSVISDNSLVDTGNLGSQVAILIYHRPTKRAIARVFSSLGDKERNIFKMASKIFNGLKDTEIYIAGAAPQDKDNGQQIRTRNRVLRSARQFGISSSQLFVRWADKHVYQELSFDTHNGVAHVHEF